MYRFYYQNFFMLFQNKKKWGFTLVEMLIVIVIIGILASALIPRLNNARGRANDTARKAALQQVSAVMVSYSIDYGIFPSCGGTDGVCPLSEIRTGLVSAGITTIPLDPNASRNFNGLGDLGSCEEMTNWEYGYIPVKKNGISNGGFVMMAGTETIGGSNTIFSATESPMPAGYNWGCLQANTVASNIITCDGITDGTTSLANCERTADADVLRYIYAY